MGLNMILSRSSYDSQPRIIERIVERVIKPKNPNPNPANYVIIQTIQVGNHLILELRYPDCTNYEGHKILFYKNRLIEEVLTSNNAIIDPHFCGSKYFVSPFARFEPTKEGLEAAYALARIL